MSLSDIRNALTNANVQAFLRVIRQGESSQEDIAYQMVNGGGTFTDFATHPYDGLLTTHGGKAAGAYQFIPSTWAGLVKAMPGGDFSPPNQDFRAVQLIAEHGALDDVIAGDIQSAIGKLGTTWVSLPGANPGYPMSRALEIYHKYGGGAFAPGGAPAVTTKGKSMDPISAIGIFGPLIANLIPQVAKLFGGGEVAQRNVATAGLVLDTVVKAADAVNVQDAVEKMQADPALTAKVQQAVLTEPAIMQVLEVGGGIVEARKANLVMQNAEKPFWFNPAFWMSLVLMPLVYWIVGAVLVGGVEVKADDPAWMRFLLRLFGTAFNQETRSGTVNLVIGMALGGIVGIWFGTSYGSMRKTEISAAKE